MDNLILTLAIYALPVVFAITLHEAAHGYVARHFGDNTAWQQGRVSLNPLRHVDMVGTLIVPAVILLLSRMAGSSGLLFGWAKPVPVDFSRLRNPKRDMLWVAAAGPGANLLMTLAWAALLKITLAQESPDTSLPLAQMALAGIEVNIVLMALNLLPLPPLDGGRIVVSLLPHRAAWQFARIEPWGFPILLLLLFANLLGPILALPIGLARYVIATLFQFS